jgi:hypothetical protein
VCIAPLFVLVAAVAHAPAADPKTDSEKLADSLKAWEKAKEECGGEYSYRVRWSSAFGFGHTTTVTVKGNKVVGRTYEEYNRTAPPPPGGPKPKWVETDKDVSTHKEGAEARTLDELYAVAKKLCEAKVPDGHVRAIGFDKQGLLAYCYTRDTRIADDALMNGVPHIELTLKQQKK